MKYIIQAYSIYEVGKRVDANGAPHQEDSIYPDPKNLSPADRLFILCDGMGGHDAGEIASATVCEALADSIGALDPEGPFTDEDFQRALTSAYDALDAHDTGAEKKMGTTMTMLKLHDAGCTIAHIGDSRVYQFRPGADKDSTRIVFRTQDHSLVNDLIKIGEITEEEARNSSQKNVITRAMQPGEKRRPKADIYHSADIKVGDWFYLCSDGMLENATDDNLRFIFSDASFKTGAEKVTALKENSAFNSDNHSAILVEVLKVIDPLPVVPPSEPQMLEAIVDDDDNAAVPGLTNAMPPAPNAAPRAAGRMTPVDPVAAEMKKQKNKNMTWMIVVLVAAIIAVIGYLLVPTIFNKKVNEAEIQAQPEQTEQKAPQPRYDAQPAAAPAAPERQAAPAAAPASQQQQRPAAKPTNGSNGKPTTICGTIVSGNAGGSPSTQNSAKKAAKAGSSEPGSTGNTTSGNSGESKPSRQMEGQ